MKSILSLFGVFLFNLPTLAALNINYQNLFVVPQELAATLATPVTAWDVFISPGVIVPPPIVISR